MKTLNEIYTEVMASDELKARFAALRSADDGVALVKELGGNATAEEIAAFINEKNTKTGELSDAELEQVAGGKGFSLGEALMSTFTVGIACATAVALSKASGNVGTGIKDSHMLCDDIKY